MLPCAEHKTSYCLGRYSDKWTVIPKGASRPPKLSGTLLRAKKYLINPNKFTFFFIYIFKYLRQDWHRAWILPKAG